MRTFKILYPIIRNLKGNIQHNQMTTKAKISVKMQY